MLEIKEGVLVTEVLHHFANEFVVPALVDMFLRTRLKLSDAAGLIDNVSQP